MRNFIYLVLGIILLFLMSCGGALVFERSGISQVQTVAVVMYSVPSEIEFREDPKEKEQGFSLQKLAKEAVKDLANGKGEEAATVSMDSFIEAINQQGLPFTVISREQMMSNSAFTSLFVPREAPEEKDDGVAATAMSMFGGGDVDMGTGPEGINAFGLKSNWGDGNALTGSGNEREYIMKAIQALNVDAALVINDFGYSFSCQVCTVGGAGSGSTGSAYHATLVNKDGIVIAQIRQWFGATSAGSVMLYGMINPLQHESLFKRHGEKTAELYAEEFQAAMKEGME
ncbi:MAG: hypothetical protein HOD92_16140 [Deltaproteobacteria bacterium]|jgi:hypothetical protein|nr:hypothetical protein [Deltaproteobacteria bacterium]